MTDEDMRRWCYRLNRANTVGDQMPMLKEMLAQVRAETVERCAKVADALADHWGEDDDSACQFHAGDVSEILMALADRIRSLPPATEESK